MNDKKTLRAYFSGIRADIREKSNKDELIAKRLLSDKCLVSADHILLYASFRSEIDTLKLAGLLLEKNIKIAFPKCHENNVMTFHTVKDIADLNEGAFGIPEPDTALPQPRITSDTVCIVPGLAFTEHGGRLGYGGGFYDRFLAENPYVYKIALAYESLITEELPIMEHDLAVNQIITEERTVFCNAE